MIIVLFSTLSGQSVEVARSEVLPENLNDFFKLAPIVQFEGINYKQDHYKADEDALCFSGPCSGMVPLDKIGVKVHKAQPQ